jgi:hypothetical protein
VGGAVGGLEGAGVGGLVGAADVVGTLEGWCDIEGAALNDIEGPGETEGAALGALESVGADEIDGATLGADETEGASLGEVELGDTVGTIVVGAAVGDGETTGVSEGAFIDIDRDIDMSIHGKPSKSSLWVSIVRKKG